jgi:hypothetical protein
VTAFQDPRVISYLTLRKTLGWLGITLPYVVILGQAWLLHGELKGSLSGYHHTGMRDWLVGSLCAIAAFLLSYRGYDRLENRLTNTAGASALGVAFFHTRPDEGATATDDVLATLHVPSAAVMFGCLAWMSWEFAKPKPDGAPADRDQQEWWKRQVYRVCALVIAGSMVGIAVLGPIRAAAPYRPALWLESLAVMAFGLSWLVKGLTPRATSTTSASRGVRPG